MHPVTPLSFLLFRVVSVLQRGRRLVRQLVQRLALRLLQGLARVAAPASARQPARRAARSDLGQTTAEYGLVILAAGSLALAAILWARNSGSITSLFQSVIDQLTGAL